VLRETLPDLVPHVRDAILGSGWQWTPLGDDPMPLDEPEEGG